MTVTTPREPIAVDIEDGAVITPPQSSATKPYPHITPVERLLAIEAVKYRKARYAYCVDHKDWEGFAANFTEDAVWDIRGAMNPRNPATGAWSGESEFTEEFLRSFVAAAADWPVVGRANIAQVARRFSETSTSAHKLFTPMIDILSATEARAIWPFEDESYSPPSRAVRYMKGAGYYHETYSKVDEDWLIRSTEVKRTLLVVR